MEYEAPEMLELGSVEELTFGGMIWTATDTLTGFRGFIREPLADEEEEVESN